MPDLRSPSPNAAVNLPVDDESAADAAADGDVEDRRQPLAGAVQRLGESRNVRVVAERRGQPDDIGNPVRQREAVPALDLVRFDDGVRRVIDGAAEADADAA